MKKAILGILVCLALCSPVTAQESGYLIATHITVDTTYTTNLLFAGIFIHATAANAVVTVKDGATTIFSWKVAADETSGGFVFGKGGIPAGTNLIIDLTNCTATVFRRYE